jgi:antitoxin (DNA-binding transcriptional repressor) of toxin-antitoxin stability system
MKKFALLLSFVFVAGVAVAQETPKTEPAKPAAKPAPAPHKTAAKIATVTGEVVSADQTKKTITFKNDKGEDLTWPAEGKAVPSLKAVKAGEKVTIAYRANEQGEPQAATSIKALTVAKTHAKAPAKASPKAPQGQ